MIEGNNSQFEGKKGWKAFQGYRQQECCRQAPIGSRHSSTGILHTLSSAKILKLEIAAVTVTPW